MRIKVFYLIKSYIFFSFFLSFSSAYSATINVTSGADSGTGSLREALIAANASSDPSNTIQFQSGLGTITLTTPLPVIKKNLHIQCAHATPQVIDGSNRARLFVARANLTIENCTLQNGHAKGGSGNKGGGGGLGAGGAIYVDSNYQLNLIDTVIVNNQAIGGTGGLPQNGTNTDGGSGGGASFADEPVNATFRKGGGGENGGNQGLASPNPGKGGNEGGGNSEKQKPGQNGYKITPNPAPAIENPLGRGGGGNGSSAQGGKGGLSGGGGGGSGSASSIETGGTGVNGGGGGGGGMSHYAGGGGGGFGGGGGGATTTAYTHSAAGGGGGGFGGGGGSGGTSVGSSYQGSGGGGGGFGGGGGGGGGSLNKPAAAPGQGGYYGGDGAPSTGPSNKGGGGGGGALGGAIFLGYNSGLTLSGSKTAIRNNLVTPGTATLPATAGEAVGKDLFLFLNNGITFAPRESDTIVADFSIKLMDLDSNQVVITKDGKGKVILKNTENDYKGRIEVKEGTLSIYSTSNLSPNATLILSGGTLEALDTLTLNASNSISITAASGLSVAPDKILTYSKPIGGSIGLTKTGEGILELTEENTYSGTTTINAGTLQGTTASLQGNITNHATLIFNQEGAGTFSGTISGSGTLTKKGLGKVIISSANTFSGPTNVKEGVLEINGSLRDSVVTVFSTATLKGAGEVGSLENNGVVSPGSSIGTLTIAQDYIQDASASLIIEIDDSPHQSDLLSISGTAHLNGVVKLKPLPGIYQEGMAWTFLKANTISGEFSQLIEHHPQDFCFNYLPNAVQIIIPGSKDQTILAVPISDLKRNAKKIASYLFSATQEKFSKELILYLRPIVKLPAEEFSTTLLELSPQQFGGLPLSNLQASVRVGNTMNRVNKVYENYFSPCYRSCRTLSSDLEQSTWFNPIGYYYQQNEMDDQVPFNVRTYGFTTGYSAHFRKHFVVSAGMGYTSSNLNWYKNRGDANIQSVYLSPSFGYVGERGYAGIMAQVSRSFYDVNRKIEFSNIKRNAHNDHKSYDLLIGFTGALKCHIPNNLILLPTVKLDYLNIFESGYQESGARAIDLSVKNVHSAFFRPEFTCKLLKQFNVNSLCFNPSVHVGWLRNIPLTNGKYTSRFYKQKTPGKNFTVESYSSITDQLVLGAGILMIHKDNYSVKIGYESNIGHYNIQEGNISFDWMF